MALIFVKNQRYFKPNVSCKTWENTLLCPLYSTRNLINFENEQAELYKLIYVV